MKFIKNVQLILADKVIEGKGLLFSERIEGIVDEKELPQLEQKYGGLEVIDGEGLYLSPGFIDIHIHGAAGFDTMDATYEAINGISKALINSGVTSFLPTTMTMPEPAIKKALTNVRGVMEKGTEGARVLGVNAEGPFINPEYKGAQAEKDIIPPRRDFFDQYLDLIRLVTIAPERKGAEGLIRHLTEEGIVVSVGHSGASYEEIIKSREWGVSHVTHLFNAMTGLHHRRPGVVGAALTSGINCELIADFIHIHPAVLRLVLQAKKLDEIVLITDSMKASYLQDGEYSLGGQEVIVKDGAARLKSGSLAGSVLTLDRALRNIAQISQLSLPELVKLVSLNQARILKLDHELGMIAPGYRADLVLFDEKINIKKVFLAGTIKK